MFRPQIKSSKKQIKFTPFQEIVYKIQSSAKIAKVDLRHIIKQRGTGKEGEISPKQFTKVLELINVELNFKEEGIFINRADPYKTDLYEVKFLFEKMKKKPLSINVSQISEKLDKKTNKEVNDLLYEMGNYLKE